MKHKLKDGFKNEIRNYAKQYKFFNVMTIWETEFKITDVGYKNILKNILQPILYKAKRAYLYNDGDVVFTEKLDFIKKVGRKLEVELSNNLFDETEHFWNAPSGDRGSIIIECNHHEINLDEIYSHVGDPTIISNLSVYFPRSAIKYAKRNANIDSDNIVFGISNNGIEMLTVFPNQEMIGHHIDCVFNNCTFSDAYMNCYGGG